MPLLMGLLEKVKETVDKAIEGDRASQAIVIITTLAVLVGLAHIL